MINRFRFNNIILMIGCLTLNSWFKNMIFLFKRITNWLCLCFNWFFIIFLIIIFLFLFFYWYWFWHLYSMYKTIFIYPFSNWTKITIYFTMLTYNYILWSKAEWSYVKKKVDLFDYLVDCWTILIIWDIIVFWHCSPIIYL